MQSTRSIYSSLFSPTFIAASSFLASCLSLMSAIPINTAINPTKAVKIGKPPRKKSRISFPQPSPKPAVSGSLRRKRCKNRKENHCCPNNKRNHTNLLLKNDPYTIRTCDLLLRRQPLYPPELTDQKIMLPISAYQLCFLNSLYLSEYRKKNGLLQALLRSFHTLL